MKLLVLAQTPPPLHGQSVMVQTLVEGLPSHGIEVYHVNLSLSRAAADIGRWRLGKLATVVDACLHTIVARFTQGCDTLYYVPAPGKRGALYRDWVIMLLCRPFFKKLVLHWHAAGLSGWLATQANYLERRCTHWLLGHADLALVLSENLRADAEALSPKNIAVVPNGIPDPAPGERSARSGNPFLVLFIGLCSEEKGLFATAEAVLAANRAMQGPIAEPKFTLIAAGAFPDSATSARFHALCAQHADCLGYAGLVHGAEKARWLRTSHCLCLPTYYRPEGQPLVLLEALAYDLPIIATRWGAIPDMLPPAAILVEPGDAHELTQALIKLRKAPPASGILRRHFLAYYTEKKHLAALAAALTDT